MTVGEVFLESISSGVITEHEISWVASHQGAFARHEEALALRLGRLVDEGQINLGCRLPSRLVQHKLVLNEWIEPLGRRRGRAAVCVLHRSSSYDSSQNTGLLAEHAHRYGGCRGNLKCHIQTSPGDHPGASRSPF